MNGNQMLFLILVMKILSAITWPFVRVTKAIRGRK